MACANDTFSTFSNFLGAFAMFVVASNNSTVVLFHTFSLKMLPLKVVFKPLWHDLRKKEKYSPLVPPRDNFYRNY